MLAFDWYITNNPRYKEIEYRLGQPTSLYNDSKDGIAAGDKSFSAGTHIKITAPEIISGQYAAASIGGMTGYVPLSSISRPEAITERLTYPNISRAINDFILSQGCPINIKFAGDGVIYKKISYAHDKRINDNNPRANLILSQTNDLNRELAGRKSVIYISYRPGNPMIATSQVGDRFNKEYVSATEYKTNPIYSRAKDKKLAQLAIFGPDSEASAYSYKHIHCLASGSPYFRAMGDGNFYELTFDKVYQISNKLSSAFLSGPYAPKIYQKGKDTCIESGSLFI